MTKRPDERKLSAMPICKTAVCVIVIGLWAAPVLAQTVAVFAPAVTDPNAALPLTPPVTYVPSCNQPTYTEIIPIVNPTEGVYADPAAPGRTCRVPLQAQIATLPVGVGYKGAVKLGAGLYGPLSTPFAVSAVPPSPPAQGCLDGTSLHQKGTALGLRLTASSAATMQTAAMRIAALRAAGWAAEWDAIGTYLDVVAICY